MRRKHYLFSLLLVGSLLLISGYAHLEGQQKSAAKRPGAGEARRASKASFRLLETAVGKNGLDERAALKVIPGTEQEALEYYGKIRGALVRFPKEKLTDSFIADMLAYYGFPALLAGDLEALSSATVMDFEQLRRAVSNKPEFEAAYQGKPLRPDEILVTRFFAPKIINVRDPQVGGVPVGGFGWRKVLRFRARQGSDARGAGLEDFYLLFNFTSNTPKFPEGIHAGQIQALLAPIYPIRVGHNDIYFLVYNGLGSVNPGKVGLFLQATFDFAGVVPDDKYFVPRSCGQCHGTENTTQSGGKINYLDTDHWIDRTGDDFKLVKKEDVLVDGVPQAYDTIRKLNREIEKQNAAVLKPGDPKFALLAARKWLELHSEGRSAEYVPPLKRGFAENAGDPVWTDGSSPDKDLLPLLNQNCFRCHSSVRYHVFQKAAVIARKSGIRGRVSSGNMPPDRTLDPATKAKFLALIDQLR
ncbi:MAG TPA: hypothetical protein VGS07_06125 [Thermoanaerobaculia bacterium]|jgi:hypothetical protein|nr:hypothetical protein [Thermoanaerobaculia bacterium]